VSECLLERQAAGVTGGVQRAAQRIDVAYGHDPYSGRRLEHASGVRERRAIAAVGWKEHDRAKAVVCEALDEVADDEMKGLGAQRQRSGPVHVVLGAADRDGRRTEGVESLSQQRPQALAEQRVGLEREVRAMLLDRAEGHDDAVAAPIEGSADVPPGHCAEPPFGLSRRDRASVLAVRRSLPGSGCSCGAHQAPSS
jgi:hypothetical protein